ncbi:MAG TPA: sigma-70 family RNA polymerase sigma factor [Pyrinomonadaceae bacterium]|nr:sigma-70 family RNA polymerase sigma factor [Pyrinomonadaceae bacterium]
MVVPETNQQSQDTLKACAAEFEAIYARCAETYPEFSLSKDDFREALLRSVEKYRLACAERGETPSVDAMRKFLSELQSVDLYLTIACASGNEPAWWQFDRQYRTFIERVARHLAGSGTDVDEVIESVYVDLFGTKVEEGLRQSKFRSYTGRGSLRGWLRTIIWHTVVDLYRRKQDEVPLEEVSRSGESRERQPSRIEPHGSEELIVENVLRERYKSLSGTALDESLATLDDHETLLLLYYHVEGLKLREIARLVERPASPIRRWFQQQSKRRATNPSKVHESTVLRWLEKVYRKVADRFRTELAQKHGLNAAEIEICESIAAEDIGRSFRINSVSNPNLNLGKGDVG